MLPKSTANHFAFGAVSLGRVGSVVSCCTLFAWLLDSEMFPAASLAFAVKLYAVEGVSPETYMWFQ
jgi:hypothetical protein